MYRWLWGKTLGKGGGFKTKPAYINFVGNWRDFTDVFSEKTELRGFCLKFAEVGCVT